MYLSHLLIDVGDNPDRPRPGRLWIRNIYHVHQRLSMAFPSRGQKEHDPLFIQPFDPGGFERPRFLFRVDTGIEDECPRVMILVQSEIKPDWEYAFKNADMFLAAPPEIREYCPVFHEGEKFRFRIHINLSKKSSQHRKMNGKIDTEGRQRSQGKRVPFTWGKDRTPNDAIHEWFDSKAKPHGFSVKDSHLRRLGWVAGYQPKRDAHMKFRSALLEGILTVNDVPAFQEAVSFGIGSAKAFGFGLLSVISMKGE